MAKNTSIDLRNSVVYQVFVRQFSKTHNFEGLINKINYIKNLGVDYIQLLPIHPIGVEHRKGTIGSPYSIKDYYEIDPNLGTKEDFKDFINVAHRNDIKVIIDIVFNHTSHDAIYTKTHPEWYCHKDDGSFCNRVGDWWDIIDFDFSHQDLQKELINVLKYWAYAGVDGYRCDVAPLLPLTFWEKARKELQNVNPDLLFISESVHLGFIKYLRDLGYDAFSDSEMYQQFDVCYDYDICDDLFNYLKGTSTLEKYRDDLIRQDSTYPKNYIKLRYLENHDTDRIAKICKNDTILRNVTAMQYFLKGMQFIYNGQECGVNKKPDLFEIDEIDFSSYNRAGIAEIMQKMYLLKKRYNYLNGIMNIELLSKDIIKFTYKINDKEIIGIFNFGDNRTIEIPDGYNIIEDKNVKAGNVISSDPIVIVK